LEGGRFVITVLRRFLLVLALMFWQGGFMFYGGVVVEVGAVVLGSHRTQGFVTQAVTNYLNVAGAVALAVWAWDVAAGRAGIERRLRWVAWVALVVLLGVLVLLHPRLDAHLEADGFRVLDARAYHRLHQMYLFTSSVQWAGALVLLALTLRAWRAEDGDRR